MPAGYTGYVENSQQRTAATLSELSERRLLLLSAAIIVDSFCMLRALICDGKNKLHLFIITQSPLKL